MHLKEARKRIITFLVLTLSLSAIFWLIIAQAGTKAQGGLYTFALMWCPGIAALVTTFIFQRNVRGLGWRPGEASYIILGYGLPILYAGIVYTVVWSAGWGPFTTQNVPPGQSLGVFILTNATIVYLLGGVLPALGEEIGWRGLLVPQLARVTSFKHVALISGAIWFAWHAPLVLFADYNSTAPRWFALLCFAIMLLGTSVAFAWLRLQSGSLWPAVSLHASHNLFIQAVFDPLTQSTALTPYLTSEFGIGLALSAIVSD